MLTGMSDESLSLQALTETKRRCLHGCAEILSRTSKHPIWALSTALKLQSIETPRRDAVPGNGRDAIAVVRNANARHHLQRLRLVTWNRPLDVVTVERSFECTSPVCTWAMYASRLSVEELVVLGDSMMRRDRRLKRASLDEFTASLDMARRWAQEHGQRLFPGYHQCRQALSLMREGTDSSPETWSRLGIMRYGMDCPQVNHPLRIAQGRTLFLDMAYPEVKVCIEYDGMHHSGQWLADTQRRHAVEDEGWRYVQATKLDLGTPAAEEQLARRVADAIGQATGRQVPLTARLPISALCDARARRRRSLWQRLDIDPRP